MHLLGVLQPGHGTNFLEAIRLILQVNSVTETVEVVIAASLMTAIFCPGRTLMYSVSLTGRIGLVVTLAVGFAPIAKWQCPCVHARRIMVVFAPNAVDCTLEVVTVKH